MQDINLEAIWNDALTMGERKPEPRDYIYASELGFPFLDRYLDMKSEEYSNPFDGRTLRTFAYGNMTEDLVVKFLQDVGLFKEAQIRHESPADEYHLSVHGKSDVLLGGDTFKSQPAIPENLDEREVSKKEAVNRVRELLTKELFNGCDDTLVEIKSIQALAFHDRGDLPYDHHVMQLGHYLACEGHSAGLLLYFCKEHACLKQIKVELTDQLKEKIDEDVRLMTKLYNRGVEPPKEPKIVWNSTGRLCTKDKMPVLGRYEKNWKLGYSKYLTRHTGFKNRAEFDEAMKDVAKTLNDKVKAGNGEEATAMFKKINNY